MVVCSITLFLLFTSTSDFQNFQNAASGERSIIMHQLSTAL